MSLFGLGPKRTVNYRPQLAGLQFSVSRYGGPVPIVYGTTRVPATLIDFNDFTAIENRSTQRAGKSTIVTVDYTYTAMVILAICEGEIDGVGVVWADKDRTDLAGEDFTLFEGALGQAIWAYLSANHPTRALNYSGTAYVAGVLNLGATGALKNYSFEVQGLFVGGLAGVAGADAEPADIIEDFLTNERYGAGWDPALIADMEVGQDGTAGSSFVRYCRALGFFISPAFVEQAPALEHLKALLAATNAGAVWSEGVLKIFPYGDEAVTGNGYTFTPATSPVYDLNASHIIPPRRAGDLISVKRRPLADAFNCIPVEFLPRQTLATNEDYNPSVVQDPDPVDTDLYGIRQGPSAIHHAITRKEHALVLSRILAQRSVYVRNRYFFRLPWRYVLLDPMDLVRITDPVRGIENLVVRIVAIEEDEGGALSVEAEEWPFGVATGTVYATEENDGLLPNNAIAPGDSTDPVMFDIPPEIYREGEAEVALATGGGDFWGGCDVWLSFDDVTFEYVGSISAKSIFGESTSALAAGTGFDVVNDVDVDLTDGPGTLQDVSDQDAQDLRNLSYLGGEFISMADATLNAPNDYTLARIQRGIYDSPTGIKGAGSPFVRVDGAVFRIRIPISRVGSPIYVKLPAFNIFGGGRQSLASVSSHSFTPTVTYPAPGVGPTLEVNPTITALAYSIDYVATGTVEVSVDGGAYSPAGGSPITGSLDYDAHTITVRASTSGQSIAIPVAIPALPANIPTLSSVSAAQAVAINCGVFWEVDAIWNTTNANDADYEIEVWDDITPGLLVGGQTTASSSWRWVTSSVGDPLFTGFTHQARFRIKLVRKVDAAVISELVTNLVSVVTGPAC